MPWQFAYTFVIHENNNFSMQKLPQSCVNSGWILCGLCREPQESRTSSHWHTCVFLVSEFPAQFMRRKEEKEKKEKEIVLLLSLVVHKSH